MYVIVDDQGNGTKYTLGQLRRDNPNISFPSVIPESTLEGFGIYPVTETNPPAYNALTQYITDYYEQNAEGTWERRWNIADRESEEIVTRLLERITRHRQTKEVSGVTWTDPSDSSVWIIDTSIEGQNRLTSAVSSAQNGIRQDGGVWKLGKVVNGEVEISYRPTTNAELIAWGQLVHDHVQKCFSAEASAVTKVYAGDYTVTFEQEFNLL